MYQFIKFHFVLRKAKSDPKKGIIYIRLTQRAIKVEFTTRLNISVDLWNPKIQKVKGTGKLAQVINAQLEHLRFQYESHRRYLMENQIALTPKILRDSLLGVQKDAQITLLDAIDHHLKRVIELKNIDYSPATVENYKRFKAYIIDATVIPLCAKVFDWAKFRQYKGAVKIHMVLDYQGCIPYFAIITDGKVHESKIAKTLQFPTGSVVVFDRAYVDYKWLNVFWTAVI